MIFLRSSTKKSLLLLHASFLLIFLGLSMIVPMSQAIDLSYDSDDDGSSGDESDHLTRENDDSTNMINDGTELDDTSFEQFDPTYPLGTEVYRQWGEEGWRVGRIESYDPDYGTYSVHWEGNPWTEYEEGPELFRMVTNAQNLLSHQKKQRYKIGTEVFKLFRQDGWWTGVIVAYNDGVYRIQWEDNSFEEYNEGPKVDRMVEDDIHHRPTTYQIGTEVYKLFEQDDRKIWKTGNVVSFEDGVYRIHWEDDTFEQYTDGAEMDQMVKDDWNIPTYEIGTEVYDLSDANRSWALGNIVSYNDGIYRVRWTDNTFSEYEDGHELAKIVNNASELPGYDMGTEVQIKVGNRRKTGSIVNFKNESYTIRWVDNSYEDFPAGPGFDIMVEDAAGLSSASYTSYAISFSRLASSASSSLVVFSAMAMCLALVGGMRKQRQMNRRFIAVVDDDYQNKRLTSTELEII